MRRACITGGAGFIGSHLADRLRAQGVEVVIVDDFRTGRREFVEHHRADVGVTVIDGDVLDTTVLARAFDGCDWVFHLQANADVRRGLDHPDLDVEQNTLATARVLEVMRTAGVSQIAFSSSGSVYGDADVVPTPENAPFPIQTSLYGASKVAGEGLISAYAHGFGFTGVAFRFVSILGERYTHGHVYDFFCQLKYDPSRLAILGDGNQEKSYLYVEDCTAAIATAVASHDGKQGDYAVYNVGTDETVVVNDSVRIICERLGVSPKLSYSGGRRGWIGDSPLIHLDCSKILGLGWAPTRTIKESIVLTLDWFESNPSAWERQVAASGVQS
jgi:UDP-glucose 4-epimerase